MPNDPLGLGDDTIAEPLRPLDAADEVSVALVATRAIDAVAELSKLLPLPQQAGMDFRRAIFNAWTQLLADCNLCDSMDDGGLNDA